MNKVLELLTHLAGINYMMSDWQHLIAEIKASGADEATQSEIIAVASKAMAAETKRNAEVNALLEKYSVADNIEPAEPDDDEEYY